MNKPSLSLFGLLLLAACEQGPADKSTEVSKPAQGDSPTAARTFSTASTSAAFISTDSANRMLKSYLTSVGAPDNDTNLRSLILDADALRAYLTEGDGTKIKTMKVMFAHTPAYMDGGGMNKNCGYRSGALTTVVAGIDANGDYVMYDGGQVLNHAMPCPSSCPVAGSGASDLLPQ